MHLPLMKKGGRAESSAVSGLRCPLISEGLDGQQGLQGNWVAAIAKTLRSNRAGCITNILRLADGRDAAFFGCFLGGATRRPGSATVHPVAITTSISMAVLLESHVDPLAIIENAIIVLAQGIYDRSSRSGGCDLAN